MDNLPRSLTPKSPCPLDNLVDLLERLHKLLVIVTSYLVAGDQIAVDIVELRVPLSH